MLKSANIKVRIPKYMTYFKCISSECEDTCCTTWNIEVDKDTYYHLKTLKFNDNVQNFFRINKGGENSEFRYASINMLQNGNCPFLDNQKLCSIQLNFNENHLPIACRTYPRVSNLINGFYEKSATVSCPEVARLILLDPHAMDIIEKVEDFNATKTISMDLDQSDFEIVSFIKTSYSDLRSFMFELIKNRSCSISERLYILGVFCNELSTLTNSDELLGLISQFKSGINQGKFKKHLARLKFNYNLAKEIYVSFCKTLAKDWGVFNKSRDLLKQCIAYLDTFSKVSTPAALKLYGKYYSTYNKQYPHVMENYILNLIYKNIFPLYVADNIFTEYSIMAVNYFIIKTSLILISEHNQKLTHDDVVTVVQSLTRTFEHNNTYKNNISTYLSQQGYNQLSYISTMLKDN